MHVLNESFIFMGMTRSKTKKHFRDFLVFFVENLNVYFMKTAMILVYRKITTSALCHLNMVKKLTNVLYL